jgi:formamidase
VTYIDGKEIGPLTNLSEDLTHAARNALIEMIDHMVRKHGLTHEQAYVVASVAVDLRVSQVVDVPNFIVSAFLPLEIFIERQ